MSQKSYSIVESTETNVGRLLVDVASTINHVRKYKVDFKYSFSGIPEVALSPTNLTSSDSLGISPDLRYYITAINITKSSMEIQIIVDQGTSVRLSVDYVAVYHNIINPMKSLFGKKVTISNIAMDAYLRNMGATIDMSASAKTNEIWIVEDAGSGNVYFKSINGKYLNSDRFSSEIGTQDKSEFQKSKSINWTVSSTKSSPNVYNITDEYNKKLQAIDSTYDVMTSLTSTQEENEFEIKLV